MAYVLSALVAVTAGVVTFRETFGAPTAYTVSELPGGGVPCKLNRFGDVAGKSADAASGESRATRWNHGGLQRQILNRFHGGDHSSATGINDAGHLAGAANLVGSVVPILWKPGVGVQRVRLLRGEKCGQVLAINRVGHVVGYSSARAGKGLLCGGQALAHVISACCLLDNTALPLISIIRITSLVYLIAPQVNEQCCGRMTARWSISARSLEIPRVRLLLLTITAP